MQATALGHYLMISNTWGKEARIPQSICPTRLSGGTERRHGEHEGVGEEYGSLVSVLGSSTRELASQI